METQVVLVGIGSNEGDSVQIVRQAMQRLSEFAAQDSLLCSRLWRTSPVDCPPGSGDFINAAVAFDALPGMTPEDLLIALKSIEREYGRGRQLQKNAPRSLDLDLLVFGQQERSSTVFTLPHPRATERLFVLAPAAEVAPDLVWPGIDLTVAALLKQVKTDELVEPLSDADVEGVHRA